MVCAFSVLRANPIYMQYEGIKGSVQVEVKNGVAKLNNLVPGTYQVNLIFTGKDAKGRDGKPRTMGHVKVFSGNTGFAGGVNVAAGDVNGDGRADVIVGNSPGAAASSHGTGMGAGKVSMQDFHFVMRTADGKVAQSKVGAGKVSLQDLHLTLRPSGNDVVGSLGSMEIKGPQPSAGARQTTFVVDMIVDVD